MKNCLIIDGMYMICKIYNGPMRFFTNSKQEHTGAVFGFLRSLLALKKKDEFKHSDIVVAWDRYPEHKYKILPSYKPGRVKRSDDVLLMQQIKRIEKLLSSLGVTQVFCDKNEADDVIASYIKQSEYDSYTIYSTDMDYAQLVSDNVVLLSTKSNGDVVYYDISKVEELYSVTVDKVCIYRAFKGDKSDGLPGVKYVKDSIICPIINDSSDIDELESKLDLSIKTHVKIKDFIPFAKINLNLATLRDDLSITIINGELDMREFENIIKELEFKSIIKSLDKIKESFTAEGFLK